MRSFVLASLVTIGITATAAHAQVPQLPEMLPYANSGPAKSMQRDIQTLTGQLRSQCVKDDAASYERDIAKYQASADAFKDAEDKANWTKYIAALRAYYKAHLAGVPGVGGYTELAAKHAEYKALTETARPDFKAITPQDFPADVAAANALIARLTAYKTKMADALAMEKKLAAATACDKHVGDWYSLKKVAHEAESDVGSYVSVLIQAEANKLNIWASNQSHYIEAGPGATWGTHTSYAGSVLSSIAGVQQFQPKVDVLVALAPHSSTLDHTLIAGHATKAKEFVAKYMPLARQLLGEVSMIKGPKDATRMGALKKFLATKKTGKMVGAATVMPVNSTTYEEWDGGRKYTVVKKTAPSYYVWKPTTTENLMPVIDGVKPEEMCELNTLGWFNYEKGGPKHAPIKTWRQGELIFKSWMLCSNKDKFSSRTPK